MVGYPMQSFRPCVRIVTQRKYRLIECFIESGAIRCDWQSRDEYAPSVVLSENFRPRWTNESKIGGETVRVDRCVRSLVPAHRSGTPFCGGIKHVSQVLATSAQGRVVNSAAHAPPRFLRCVHSVHGERRSLRPMWIWTVARDPTGKRTVNADRRQQPSESTSCRTGHAKGAGTAIGPTPSVSVRCTARRSPRAPPATPAARTGRRTPRRVPGPVPRTRSGRNR